MSYEPWLLPYIPAGGKLALDIGSATGEWTYPLADRFEKVIAFDPVQHLPVDYGHGNVDFRMVALWSHAGSLRFTTWDEDRNHTSAVFTHVPFVGYSIPTSERDVQCVTLDSLGLEPDFIKVDTEGAEVEVVRGGIETISSMRPAMVIEIHGRENEPLIRGILAPYYPTIVKIDNPEGSQDNYWLAFPIMK